MNATPDLDHVFPLSAGTAPRPALRPPRLPAHSSIMPALALSDRELLRAWAARRARKSGVWTGSGQSGGVSG